MKNKVAAKKENHALIFSSFKNEMSKSRIIDKVRALMPLSYEEAHDLVNRTPIIVLDEMEREEGERLQEYFMIDGCELVLTQDNVVKRKCYRILWPQRPVLDFGRLSSVSETIESVSAPKAHEPSEVKPRIPEPSPAPKTEPVAPKTVSINNEVPHRELVEKLEAEKKQLHGLLGDLQKENEDLKQKVEEVQAAQASHHDQAETLRLEVRRLKEQIQTASTQKSAVTDISAKCVELEKELSMASSLEKDAVQKLSFAKTELDSLRAAKKGLETKIQKTEGELKAKGTESEKLAGELASVKSELEMAHKNLSSTTTSEKELSEKARLQSEALKRYEKEVETLRKNLEEKTKDSSVLREDLEQAKSTLAGLKTAAEDQEESLRKYENECRNFERSIEESEGMVRSLREELAQVVVDKNNFIDELKAKTELLDLKEEEYRRTQDSFKEIAAQHKASEEMVRSLESQLERSQEALLRVTEEKSQQKVVYTKDLTEKNMLLEKQSGELSRSTSEISQLHQKINERDEIVAGLRDEVSDLKDYKERYTITRDKYLDYKNEAENKLSTQTSEIRTKDTELIALRERSSQHEAMLAELGAKHNELQDAYDKLQKIEEINRQFRDRYHALERESSDTRQRLQAELMQTKDVFEKTSGEFTELHERHRGILSQYESLKSEYEKLETGSSAALSERASRIEELERHSANLEAQLDGAQRQLKEMHQQAAQQELIQKRLLTANQITEHEARLKLLVEKQGGIEREIHEREDSIKMILKEQEDVEKEIIRNKQIQKHLLEQAKVKEKQKVVRKSPNLNIISPEQESE